MALENELVKIKKKEKPHVPSWGIYIILKGEDDFSDTLYFGAFNGGEAKHKALFMLQHYLRRYLEIERIWIVLRRPFSNNGSRNAPSYILARKYTYRRGLLEAHRASLVFDELNDTDAELKRRCHNKKKLNSRNSRDRRVMV